MTRKLHKLEESEVKTLLFGMASYGAEETYKRMEQLGLSSAQNTDDVDEIFMDKYHDMLGRARSVCLVNEDSKDLQKILYQLASMLRVVAHKVHRIYAKERKNEDSGRFLELISYNEDIPPGVI